MGNRWLASSSRRSAEEYDRCWTDQQRDGRDIHGEAEFVFALRPASVLDAGCGTGRVAVELARRGISVVGVDIDQNMLRGAETKAPELDWHLADLAEVDLREGGRRRLFDAVVLAGNVMIFLEPGTEGAVVANLARHLGPGGALVAGFQLSGQLDLPAYDRHCAMAGLAPDGRWATWERDPWRAGGDYAVSLHRRPVN